MKNYILFTFLLFSSIINAQTSTEHKLSKKEVINNEAKNYTDSLNLARKMVYDLDYSNLIKQKERFTYLSREKSNKIYPAVLTIITDRIKNYNNEK